MSYRQVLEASLNFGMSEKPVPTRSIKLPERVTACRVERRREHEPPQFRESGLK
jgi:hypothetical protein